jgi:hypothetical protein
MTEAEWEGCENPEGMLQGPRGRVSGRIPEEEVQLWPEEYARPKFIPPDEKE